MNLLSNEKATFIVITMDTLNISGNIFYSRWEEKYFQYNKNSKIFIRITYYIFINKSFCSTLSEFENFLLCERILINVTNFKDFKRFGAFKGLVEQKKTVVFNSFVCKLGLFWHSWAFKMLVSLAF
jgi:hypothetical protein